MGLCPYSKITGKTSVTHHWPGLGHVATARARYENLENVFILPGSVKSFKEKRENAYWTASSSLSKKSYTCGHHRMSLGRGDKWSVTVFTIFVSIQTRKQFLVLAFIWKQSTCCRIPRYGLWGRNQTAAANKADGN